MAELPDAALRVGGELMSGYLFKYNPHNPDPRLHIVPVRDGQTLCGAFVSKVWIVGNETGIQVCKACERALARYRAPVAARPWPGGGSV